MFRYRGSCWDTELVVEILSYLVEIMNYLVEILGYLAEILSYICKVMAMGMVKWRVYKILSCSEKKNYALILMSNSK